MNDPAAKMYAQLTPVELGTLAVKYLVAGDDLELTRITRACPRQTYTMPDGAYTDRIEKFLRMANAWGMLYWQQQHERMQAALCLSIALHKGLDIKENESEFEGSRAMFSITESCLLAMDVALDEVCKAHGFDAADVRKIADAQVFVPLKSSQAVPHIETVAKVKDMLLYILQS